MSEKEEELLKEVSGYLHGYLKSGTVNIHSFFNKANINITNLEQLLKVRFLLKEETNTFVCELPSLLKRFKTTTTSQTDTHIGEIRGEIDWEQTTKERLRRNHKDRTIFSTNESVRSYNIPENLVLKELLSILYDLSYKNDYIKGLEQSDWFQHWQKVKGNVARAYKKNIYLQRVDHIRVSKRMIQKTLRHRNKLYRQAAQLLLTYRQLMSGEYDEADIRTLLRETFIAPDNVDVLFELYWIVQLIKSSTDHVQMHLMDGRDNIVASWTDKSNTYRLYHDSTGSGAVNFRVKDEEIADSTHPYLQRTHHSFTATNEIIQEVFGHEPSNDLWRGRPDFLLEIYAKETDKLRQVTIGEVKNTSNKRYVITGMEELLEYIHFARDRKGDYMLGGDVEVSGVLCVEKVDVHGNQDLVKVLSRN